MLSTTSNQELETRNAMFSSMALAAESEIGFLHKALTQNETRYVNLQTMANGAFHYNAENQTAFATNNWLTYSYWWRIAWISSIFGVVAPLADLALQRSATSFLSSLAFPVVAGLLGWLANKYNRIHTLAAGDLFVLGRDLALEATTENGLTSWSWQKNGQRVRYIPDLNDKVRLYALVNSLEPRQLQALTRAALEEYQYRRGEKNEYEAKSIAIEEGARWMADPVLRHLNPWRRALVDLMAGGKSLPFSPDYRPPLWEDVLIVAAVFASFYFLPLGGWAPLPIASLISVLMLHRLPKHGVQFAMRVSGAVGIGLGVCLPFLCDPSPSTWLERIAPWALALPIAHLSHRTWNWVMRRAGHPEWMLNSLFNDPLGDETEDNTSLMFYTLTLSVAEAQKKWLLDYSQPISSDKLVSALNKFTTILVQETGGIAIGFAHELVLARFSYPISSFNLSVCDLRDMSTTIGQVFLLETLKDYVSVIVFAGGQEPSPKMLSHVGILVEELQKFGASWFDGLEGFTAYVFTNALLTEKMLFERFRYIAGFFTMTGRVSRFYLHFAHYVASHLREVVGKEKDLTQARYRNGMDYIFAITMFTHFLDYYEVLAPNDPDYEPLLLAIVDLMSADIAAFTHPEIMTEMKLSQASSMDSLFLKKIHPLYPGDFVSEMKHYFETMGRLRNRLVHDFEEFNEKQKEFTHSPISRDVGFASIIPLLAAQLAAPPGTPRFLLETLFEVAGNDPAILSRLKYLEYHPRFGSLNMPVAIWRVEALIKGLSRAA